MARHPTGTALLAACRAGQGVLIIVEGEREEDDAWFYNRWFAPQATNVTFIAQNGWEQVVRAVAELRSVYPRRRLFGLVDRDHTPGDVIIRQLSAVPEDGVFRTTRFTMENHLLEPGPLLELLRLIDRGEAWTFDRVASALLHAFRRHVSMAAYNRAVWEIARDGGDARFVSHPDGVPTDAAAALAAMASPRAASAATVFQSTLAALSVAPLAELHQHVSGKYVVRSLDREFPGLKGLDAGRRLALLAGQATAPPADLAGLVHHILSLG